MDGLHIKHRIALPNSIILSTSQKQQLAEHAKKSAPNEGCALLLGKKNNNTVNVHEIFFAHNKDESPVNFTISEEELIQQYHTAEQKKLDIVGIFHSHPDSQAIPSKTDKKFMHINPVVWVIYSNKEKNFMAYLFDSDVESVKII